MARTEESKAKNREYMRTYNLKYYAKNKEKVLARNKRYNKEHSETITQMQREWRKKNPEKTRNARLKFKYGISLEEYNVILESQNGVCAICHELSYRNLAVDHSHVTGKVRGLLCDPCNVSLGLLGERIETIERILVYLKNYA